MINIRSMATWGEATIRLQGNIAWLTQVMNDLNAAVFDADCDHPPKDDPNRSIKIVIQGIS